MFNRFFPVRFSFAFFHFSNDFAFAFDANVLKE